MVRGVRTKHLDRSLLLAIPPQWISLTESVIIKWSWQRSNESTRSRSKVMFGLRKGVLIDALDQLGLIVGCTVMAIVVVLTISRWINRRGKATKDQAT